MTSFPSDINLLINNLSTFDKENFINDIEKSEHTVTDSYDDKEKIIKENGGYSLIGNDIKYYVEIYNKFWPYRVLKITNWLLLILLVVGSVLVYDIRWSGYMPAFMGCGYSNSNSVSRTFCINSGDSFVLGQLLLVVLGLITLIFHRFATNIFKAAVCSLMVK
uniref:Innexin n=1 Tax=Meloidogyne hapla TaxID=6305 RepID=A0A1I8B335_MELHA